MRLPQQLVIPSDATSTKLSVPESSTHVSTALGLGPAPLESDDGTEVRSSVSTCVHNSRRSIQIQCPPQDVAAHHTDANTNLLEASAPTVTATAVAFSEPGDDAVGVCCSQRSHVHYLELTLDAIATACSPVGCYGHEHEHK